jgi:hypothetical protein
VPTENYAYARALERAAEIAGGVDELAAKIGVSKVFLRACITGYQPTPIPLFLKVVDFLLERTSEVVFDRDINAPQGRARQPGEAQPK